MQRRVVVTGIGAITPLGSNALSLWLNIISSKSGVRAVTPSMFDTSDLATKIAGIIPTIANGFMDDPFDPSKILSLQERRKMDPFIVLGIAAAIEAVEDSGISDISAKNRVGVMIGSGIGGLQTIADTALCLHTHGPKKISPFFIPSSLINLIAGHVSIKYGFKGPNHAVATACSTGTHAIGDAWRMIKDNQADIMIAGGAEAAVSRIGIAGFNACRALSTNFNDNPQAASRPWDKRRDGFVISEGAGVLILEEYEHAKKRGAKIYGEVVGYGLSGDANHITAPHPEGAGALQSMVMAIETAGIAVDDITYINAHGTSTPLGDMIELNAIESLFGKNRNNKLYVSSTKSAIGHMLGASGAVEAILTLLSLQHGILPPTLNLDEPEYNGQIDLVPHKAKEVAYNYAISNSFGFGGTNATLCLKRF